MPRRDELYLGEVVEAADLVGTFLDGVSVDEWGADEEKLEPYCKCSSRSGRLVGRLTRNSSAGPGVPWARVAGFRNVTVHEYFAIEWPIVWHLARVEMPVLRRQVLDVLRADFPEVARRYEERG